MPEADMFEDKKHGLFFKKNDVNHLGGAITLLHSSGSILDKMSRNTERATQNFNTKVMSQKVMALLSELKSSNE